MTKEIQNKITKCSVNMYNEEGYEQEEESIERDTKKEENTDDEKENVVKLKENEKEVENESGNNRMIMRLMD